MALSPSDGSRSPPALVLVPAGEAAACVLSLLHGACFEDAWAPPAMGRVLGSPGTFAVLALAPEPGAPELEPWGFAIGRVAADEAELLSLGVAPARRRLGVAARLLAEVLARAGRAGARRIFLEVAEDNEGARALYRGKGFVAVGRRPGYYRRAPGPAGALTLALALGALALGALAPDAAPERENSSGAKS